ncbi:O-antigen ligase family protein [Candidatus Peregrinibacteria bacterium]|nr:O-antigen ligase family protein [Candidatus Peregrinibacteria bacterium]
MFLNTLNKILLIINILFIQSYLIRFHIGPYPSNLQEILIAVNALTFLSITPIKEIFAGLKRHRVITLLIGLTLLTSIISLFEITEIINQLTYIRHLKFTFFGLALSFIFLETFRSGQERLAGLRIMGIGAVAFGIFSAIYNLLGFNVTHDYRLLGPLDGAISMAFYLAPFFIFFTIDFFETKKKISLAFALILAILIATTRSMGTIAGSLAILIIYALKKRMTKTTLIITATISLFIVALIFYTKILPTLNTNYSSLDERRDIWQTSMTFLREPKNFIFGLGLGQFEENYLQNVYLILGRPPLDYHVLHPHNTFLLFIFNYGIAGLIFISWLIYNAIKNFFQSSKIDLRFIASLIFLYFALHGMIDTPFFRNDLLFLLILFMELLVKNQKEHSIQDF